MDCGLCDLPFCGPFLLVTKLPTVRWTFGQFQARLARKLTRFLMAVCPSSAAWPPRSVNAGAWGSEPTHHWDGVEAANASLTSRAGWFCHYKRGCAVVAFGHFLAGHPESHPFARRGRIFIALRRR